MELKTLYITSNRVHFEHVIDSTLIPQRGDHIYFNGKHCIVQYRTFFTTDPVDEPYIEVEVICNGPGVLF